jgi:low affinity Fe/Cu permease
MMKDLFARWAQLTSETIGHPVAFAAAALIIVVWALSGFAVGFGDTWQLVINKRRGTAAPLQVLPL